MQICKDAKQPFHNSHSENALSTCCFQERKRRFKRAFAKQNEMLLAGCSVLIKQFFRSAYFLHKSALFIILVIKNSLQDKEQATLNDSFGLLQ